MKKTSVGFGVCFYTTIPLSPGVSFLKCSAVEKNRYFGSIPIPTAGIENRYSTDQSQDWKVTFSITSQALHTLLQLYLHCATHGAGPPVAAYHIAKGIDLVDEGYNSQLTPIFNPLASLAINRPHAGRPTMCVLRYCAMPLIGVSRKSNLRKIRPWTFR